jgi:LysM repeat protein
MVCQVQVNSIKYLEDEGATNDVRRIIDEELFNTLNEKLTVLAEKKYGLKTDGTKLFSLNTSEHIDPRTSTYRRDSKYRVIRAEPNTKLFERLQDLYNSRPNESVIKNVNPFQEGEQLSLFQLDTNATLEPAIEELDKYLLNFLKPFGVKFKEFEDLKAKLGVNALGATDVLNKLIWYNKNRNAETVPEEVGHMVTMLMGETNSLMKDLLESITDWSEYDKIYKQYMPIYNNVKQVKIEAVGKLIAKSLVKNYKASGTDKTLLEKALAVIEEFIEKIFGTFKNNLLAQMQYSENIADHIAINILMGDKNYIAKLDTSFEKLDYDTALKNNKFAQSIIDIFTKMDAKLTGSLAIAGQGDIIYRSSEEPIHDVDFTVKNKEDFEDILDKVESMNGVPAHYGWSNKEKQYTTYAYIIPLDGLTVEVLERDFNRGNGWVTQFNLRDKNGNIVEKTKENHMPVDFFVYNDGTDASKAQGIFKSTANVYLGKATLSTAKERIFTRNKDQKDYILHKSSDLTDSLPEFTYYQMDSSLEEIDGVLFMDVKLDELQNERSKEIAEVLAQRLALGTKTQFEKITAEEAANILKNRPVKYNGEPAFYYAGTVYVVGDNVNVRTVLHEFCHPVLQGLRKTNNLLFQNLYSQALATEEGQGIYYYVKANYPELEENSDLFKEEVLAYAMQLKALNRINNEIETEGYKNFMNKLMAAIKQLLRKLFGNKVEVSKLDVDTTLGEMADMLLDKDFEFQTDDVTEEDLAMFSRNVVDRARELASFSNAESQLKVVREMYETNKRILTEVENFKGDKASRKLLKETIFEKGTNRYIREVVSTLRDHLNTDTEGFTENELIQNALDAAKEAQEVDLQRATALVNTIDNINSMTKNMLLDVSRLGQSNINSRSTIALLMLYKQNSKAWLKMVQAIDESLSQEGKLIESNNPFYQSLNEIVLNITRINTNIANILKNNNVQFYVEITGYMSKYVQDQLRSNLGNALKKTFSADQLEKEVDDLYNKVVQQTLTDTDVDALIQKGVPGDVLKGFLKEYKNLVVDEDKIKAALTGGAKDVSWFNRWLESYSSSNDVIVGPLAMFIQNEKTQIQNIVWESSSKFRKKLEELLPKVGFNKMNSIQLREKLGFKDKIMYFDKETGKPIEREVWSYLDKYKDYRYHYDLLEWNIEEAKKSEDQTKIADAVMEFDQFKRDYMWQEYVPEYYEKDDIFKKSEVGKLAYFVRKQKLLAYNNLLNSMENELERFEKYSTTQAAFREFQQLYSLTYEDGTSKVDDPENGVYDLSIAQVLLEHRAATKGFNEWTPIEGLLQSAYNEFVDLLETKKIYQGSAEFKAELEKWRRQNLRMEYDPAYWESRNALVTELRELQTRMNEVAKSKFDVATAFQTINDLIYSYRDEQGEPDSSAMGKTRLERIRDTEQAIADFKFKYDMSTGLSKEDSEELKDLQYKASKGLLQAGTPESKRYMYLLDMQESEGILPEDAARIEEIFGELSELSINSPTTYYMETLNYNLSKQNIKEQDEDEINDFINSDEFQDILDGDEEFRNWFELNHYVIQTYDKPSRGYVSKYKRTKANTVAIPRDESHIKFTKILDREGKNVLLMGVPNARHSRYQVKDQYRTIPFGASKEDYVGKYVDNKNHPLPRMYDPNAKHSARDGRFMNEKYFQMQSANSNEFQLLEAIKEYHLENQKGQSSYSKLYHDMPRYALKKGDIYQAIQKGAYGQRFSELGKNVKEWVKQAVGKSVMDAENDLNYNPENNLVNTDLDGNQISYIPVSGIYNLDIDVQDADIFQGLFRYGLSVQTQGKLLESLPLVQSILDTLEDPNNAPKELEKFDKNIFNLKGALTNAKKKFATNNRLGQVKSLIEREYYGKMVEGIEETHPQFGKWVSQLQGLSATGSLAISMASDLKNKYGAYVQLILEGAGAEFINLKDIALARPWAEKAMLEWSTKGIYQTGPGAVSTQLIQIFDPNFKSKDQFGREVERSMVKDLVNMEWMYMHRKFGEMQVAVSLFGSFMYGQKVDQVLSDGTKKSMRYIEAWEKDDDGIIRLKKGVHPGWNNLPVYHEYVKGESLEEIAKKYSIPVDELKAKNRIKSEVQLEDGQEIIIAKSELFMGLKNRIQGTSRKLFGTYDDMGQPEGNKLLLYRMFFFMRKWFTPMFTNRFGADLSKENRWGERYDWATGSYGKGFYITAFQTMLKTMKSGFKNYSYLTDKEKSAVRKMSTEGLFTIGLALLGLMLFGFDPDDDDKWKKLRAKSGAINEDNYNTYGFLANHMLLLTMGVQAETSAFIPLPSVKGINFGADDYVKMITQTTSAWYNTVVLYIDIFGDVLDFVTFSEMDRYKRDTGPYSWKREGELKIWGKLGKTVGLTGATGDPVTQMENMFKNSAKLGN